MFRSVLCLLAALVTGGLMPADASAQYGGGPGGGYYGGGGYGGGGGYHADDPPRRERRGGQKAGAPQSGGKQCYTKRTKVGDRWESQRVCE